LPPISGDDEHARSVDPRRLATTQHAVGSTTQLRVGSDLQPPNSTLSYAKHTTTNKPQRTIQIRYYVITIFGIFFFGGKSHHKFALKKKETESFYYLSF